MSSSEPDKEQELESELPFADEIPEPTEIKNQPRFTYKDLVQPIIIFGMVNASCLGVTYSNISCLSFMIILLMMFLIPRFTRYDKRRIRLLSLYALISVFPIGMCVIPLIDPIHAPNLWTELYLLRLTPPGTPRSEVQALIAKKGWKGGKFYVTEYYFSIPEKQRPISVTLSNSEHFGMPATHYAEWIFDEEGKVITVNVTTFAIFL